MTTVPTTRVWEERDLLHKMSGFRIIPLTEDRVLDRVAFSKICFDFSGRYRTTTPTEHDKVQVLQVCSNNYWRYVKTWCSEDPSTPCFLWVERIHLDLMTGYKHYPGFWSDEHLSPTMWFI